MAVEAGVCEGGAGDAVATGAVWHPARRIASDMTGRTEESFFIASLPEYVIPFYPRIGDWEFPTGIYRQFSVLFLSKRRDAAPRRLYGCAAASLRVRRDVYGCGAATVVIIDRCG
jgi:hypothetical protein